MRISIVTPCYNAAHTLPRTMDSVASQTMSPYEYIVVDGASQDGSADLARAHPAVTRVISEPDKGIADAFNKGIALATGDVVGIVNADDWYEPDALEVCARLLHETGAGVVHGVVRYWRGATPFILFYPCLERMPLEMTVNHPGSFVSRSIYQEYGAFDSRYRHAMDYDLMLRLWRCGVRFAQADTVLANMSLGGLTDREWHRMYIDMARVKAAQIGHPLAAWGYCGYQIFRTGCRKVLEAVGLHNVVSLWRTTLSPMQKHCVRRPYPPSRS